MPSMGQHGVSARFGQNLVILLTEAICCLFEFTHFLHIVSTNAIRREEIPLKLFSLVTSLSRLRLLYWLREMVSGEFISHSALLGMNKLVPAFLYSIEY